MMAWTWTDAFPGHRAVTLLLPADVARALLEQAAADGRIIAPDTIMGLANGGAVIRPATPAREPATATPTAPAGQVHVTVRSSLPGPVPVAIRLADTKRPAAPKPPVVEEQQAVPRPEPLPPRPTPRSAAVVRGPINPDLPPAKKIDADLRTLIDQAVKAGKVTKCPPQTFAIDAAEGSAWARKHRKKAKGRLRAGPVSLAGQKKETE